MLSSMVSRIRASSKVRNISKSSCFICIDASDAGDYIAARCHNSFLAMRVSLIIDNLLIHRHGLSRLHLYKSDFGSATPASSFVSVHPSAFPLASAAAAHTAIASSSLIELQEEGVKVTLNNITDAIFRKGQDELKDALEEKISELEDERDECEEDSDEYEELQEQIDELECCDPEEDVEWFCNCLDTSIWFKDNEEIYRKYLEDEISDIEDNMGFEF